MAAEAGDTQSAASSASSSLDSEGVPPAVQAKTERILKACDAKDLDGLISLAATQYGFVNDELRRKVCMFMTS